MDILSSLRNSEKCVSEIAEEIGEDRSKVSHSLRHLLKCNFVFVEKKGRKRIYTLNKSTIKPLLDIADKHVVNHCKECGMH